MDSTMKPRWQKGEWTSQEEAEAITAFDDPFALIAFDEEHSHSEVREVLES